MNDLISLSQLFDKRIYRIPDYQRGYAWTNSQLEDFWDDLNNLTEERYHYTGMLSLKLLKEDTYSKWNEELWILKEKGYSAFHVVDGQQRLTTFIILISSIIQFANNNNIEYLNGDDLEEIKSRYIVEYKKPLKINKAFKFGYESDNPSFEFLRYNILGEGQAGSLQETFYTLNLENAKKFFDDCLKKLFNDKGIDGLESLFRKLVNRLQFNIHYIEDDFDVFVAFETMNNRGKKLSNLEILKNRLIYLTTIYPDNVLSNDDKDQIRKDINDAWKEVYFELGRNKDKPLNDDEYLRNHWTLFFKYSRNTGDDYIDFLLGNHFTAKAVYGLHREPYQNQPEEIDDEDQQMFEVDENDGILTPTEIKLYVDSLKSVAQYWYFSFNPNECKSFTDEEKKWILKLNRIGINYFRTLVVASFLNKNTTAEKRIRLFKIIEKSIFVYFRMAKWQASYQSTVAYNFARELYKEEKTIDEISNALEDKFSSVKAEAIETFTTKIQGLFKNNNGYYSWSDLRYFLFEYEMSLYEKTFVPKLTDWDSFTKSEKDKISIEHIFPQTPTKYYWRNQFRNYTSEEFHYLANSLGNLLALSQSVNSALQNDEFEDKKNPKGKKRRGYANGSHSEVEVAQYKDWTPDCIKERGLKLLEFLENRWDVKFAEDSKLKVLGLEFMNEQRASIPELDPDDVSTVPDLENSKTPLRDLVGIKIKDILDDEEKKLKIHILKSSNSYLRFTGSNIRNKVGQKGNGSWSGIEDLVVYEIKNTVSDGVFLTLFIGPSDDQKIRLKWHNFAKNNPLLGGRYKVMKKQWDPMGNNIIFSKPRDTFKSDEEYLTTTLENVLDFFENVFNDIEDLFANAPDNDDDEIFSSKEVKSTDKVNHYFKEIDFESSLTGLKYHGSTNDDGSLKIVNLSSNEEVPNNSSPNKKAIIGQAIIDLGGSIEKSDTLYQRYHRLSRMIDGGTTENWIVACNKKFFDIDKALEELGVIEFSQYNNIQKGSKVYIYIPTPYEKAIQYECEAVVVDKIKSTIDDSKYVKDASGLINNATRFMELKLVRKLDVTKLGWDDLKAHGLTSNIQGPCRVPVELQKYIDSVTDNK